MHAITVTVKGHEPAVVSAGTRISELLPSVDEKGFPVLGAIVNNMALSLFVPLITDAAIAPLTIEDEHGWNIYRTSLCFLVAKTAHELFPNLECRVRNSIGAGIYCTVAWPELTPKTLRRMSKDCGRRWWQRCGRICRSRPRPLCGGSREPVSADRSDRQAESAGASQSTGCLPDLLRLVP